MGSRKANPFSDAEHRSCRTVFRFRGNMFEIELHLPHTLCLILVTLPDLSVLKIHIGSVRSVSNYVQAVVNGYIHAELSYRDGR